MRTINLAILAATVSVAASFAAHAAGLGRLTVFSSLGAPLNAEIEIVSLQPGEQESLAARIASIEAFRSAGIEPSAALSTVRFAIARREGRPVVRVTSLQPVNEPFLDLLVELEWAGGRLVREYTFLLDPPQYRGPQPIAAEPAVPVQAPAASQSPSAPAASAAPAPATVAAAPAASNEPTSSPSAESQPPIESKPLPAQEPAAAPAQAAGQPGDAQTHAVRRGETLGEIARAHLPPGVTMNQMLIALYRANQDAFIRENINLVRAGRVLTLPSAEEARGIEVAEANRMVLAHRAEWDEYRTRLAAVPAPAESASGSRAVAGKIEPKLEAPTAAPQDQVRLSKVDPKAAAGGRAARADDLAARERELKEAQSRVADLEKNVADLQKLLEVRNQQVSELERKAAAATPAAAPPKPAPAAEAPKPAPAAQAPKPAPAAEAPKPAAVAEVPKPAPAVPAPVEAKKAAPPVEAKKAEAPKPKAAPQPVAPPSLLDEFLENTAALGGLGLVVLLLVGYGLWSWRRKKAALAKFSDSVMPTDTSSPALKEPALAAAGSSSQVSVSQASGMEAEEVDPIAEADVYMAYGRDAQAEEILKEALQKDPNRIPVHAKLLEIYSKRGDAQAFEASALKLKNLTAGAGPEWDKAVALGRSVDPGNDLYGGSGAAGVHSAPAAAAAAAAAAIGAAAAAPVPSIDFDIGGGTSPGMVSTDIPLGDAPKPATPSTIDFDLSGSSAKVKPGAFAGSDALNLDNPDPDATLANIKFDLNPGGSAPEPKLGEASGLDFDLNLEGDDKAQSDSTTPPMDLSSISLDLGSAAEAGGAASSNDPKWQEVATKLDLAKAYEEMGDKDGARELLGEVMKDGDAAQKGQAQQLLTKLG